ncbi:MAG: ABC transporter permease [Candidatus Krumholzibacteriia bacterium]
MLSYVARRLLGVVPLVLVISLICFGLMHAAPGGPTGVLASNPKLDPSDLARIRANFGLDRPLAVQYGMWLERVFLHGDLGYSYVTGEPVLNMIGKRLPATLELAGSALLFALLIGIGVGVLSALRPRSRLDVLLTIGSLMLISIPVFWSGLMAMMLFSVKWKLLPSAGLHTVGMPFSIIDHLRHLVMPSLVLALVFIASWSRYMRASMAEVLSKDFIDVARAKGLPPVAVVLKHALRNAAAPVLTVVALNLPLLFTGAIITETVFSWPGMGRLFYEGLLRMDYSRVMGIVLIASFLIAVTNLVTDCIYGYLDPRIRHADQA